MNQNNKKPFEIIIEKIEADIAEGRLHPGEKLPAERTLAEKMNVSRTSVREALISLEYNGLIEIKHGKGSFVKEIKKKTFEAEAGTALNTGAHLLYEMLEFRAVLEVESALLAAQRASTKDLEKIQRALEWMKKAGKEIEAGIEADVAFHVAIVEATHNSVFIQLINSMQGHMADTIRATRTQRFSNPNRYTDTFEEHKQMYVAIATQDETLAKQLMSDHIAQIRRELSESMLK